MRTADSAGYLNQVFGLADEDLERVRATLVGTPVERMAITAAEGRLLQFFVRGFGIRSIVEIGSLYGFSALCMAKVLPEGGRLIGLERDPEHARIAAANLAFLDNVEFRCGDASELLNKMTEPVDMVFIDADKPSYLKYLDWAELRVKKGGLIIGDNTFLFGSVWGDSSVRSAESHSAEVMREFNRRLADPSKYNSILIPTISGLTVAQKTFDATEFKNVSTIRR